MTEFQHQTWTVDAPLSAVAVDRSSKLAAFAGGDGVLRLVALTPDRAELASHDLTNGAVLSLVADSQCGAFLAGTDDGDLYGVSAEGHERLLNLKPAWPDQLAAHTSGIRAVADGQDVRLLSAEAKQLANLKGHPSTVAGLHFDASGARLAVSHYDGASIWDIATVTRTHMLYFRGSHLNLSWQPEGRYLVTTTQEKMLHAWDLETGEDASLGPCFKKVSALGWSADGNWLLASGNDTISAWRFDRGLPRPAPKLLGRFSELLIGQVCPHPTLGLTAVAYNDGGTEIAAITSRNKRHELIVPPAARTVALRWSPDGNHLVGGDLDGRLFVYRFDKEWLARLSEID